MFHTRCQIVFVLALLLVAGCTPSRYRKNADKEAYSIIQEAERKVFGGTNLFDIGTKYSDRKPEEIAPREIIGDRQETNRMLLTLNDALNLAATNSHRFQRAKEVLYLSALNLTGERYAFGPKFFANTSAGLNRDANGNYSRSVDSSAGIGQMALRSGGTISAGLANSVLQFYTGNPRRTVASTLSASLVQPLLRGFGKNSQAVENLTQSERDVIYAVRAFTFFQNDFASEIVSDYFNLLSQRDVLRNRYTNYLGRVQSTRRLEARSKDRELASDVDQTRQAELTARNNYVNAQTSYENALDQFKIKLNLPLGFRLDLDEQLLAEVQESGLVPVDIDAREAFRVAVERQLPILTAIDTFEDLKRQVRVASDKLKPGLNLVADATLQSDGPTDYTTFDPKKVRAGVGLELDLPLDRLRERNSYRATLISFEVGLRTLSATLDNLKDAIERGLRNLDQRRQNYEIQKQALQLANRRVESATLLLQAGRGEVRNLVEAQDAQISAQNAVTQALVGYQDQRLQLMLDLGVLETESEKFWLKDHTVAAREKLAPAPGRTVAEPAQLLTPDELFAN